MASLHVQYRPTSFDQVLGQSTVIKSLKKVIKDDRARAFIFTGPSGCGKTTIARILANTFASDQATVANIDEVDAATNSGADAMRTLLSSLTFRAMGFSPVKVAIIDEAHRLSSAAWTILLKPVEEPPRHVYWMFCTTEAAKIPKTIQTRCLRYDLKPVGEDDILGLLCDVCDAEKLKVPDAVLEAISEGSGGSPRQALVYLESCAAATTANEARQIMRSAGQTKEIVDLAKFLMGGSGRSWAEAMKYIQALDGTDAESVRIALCAYFSAVLMNTNDDARAAALLGLIEPFLPAFDPPARAAPLLHAVGLALGLDR